VEADPVEADPVEADPVEADPVEADPVEADPVKTAEPVIDAVITGGTRSDKLEGTPGNDVISGGRGPDRITGSAGDDTIIGGAHNDRLAGGEGDDTFVYGNGDGRDIIADFLEGDTLRFDGEGFSADELVIEQKGSDAVVSFAGSKKVRVTLTDTEAERLRGYSTTETDDDVVIVTLDKLE